MFAIRGRRVVCPDGERPASISIDGGLIVSIDPFNAPLRGDVVDAGDLIVSPGLIDTHVHVNEPGRTEWEGFDTATRAAAAGGVTTIVDMPLNSIPATTTVASWRAKTEAARGRCHVDVAMWGGVVPGNEADLDALADAGVRGFKCFLVPSGVDEFAHVDATILRRAMPILARRQLPLLVHAELPEHIHQYHGAVESYLEYEATRPPAAEAAAIELMAQLAKETGTYVHIVHVSSADGVATLAKAQAAGIHVSGESCPHYLTMTDTAIPSGATEFKCAPPIRTAADRDALWRGLESGVLALIASDHSPAPPAVKCPGDFSRAWGGIASLELSLPVVWTHARERGRTPSDLSRWMSAAPAALAGLSRRKGTIEVNADADLVIWNPNEEFTVDASHLHQRHKLTPYAGRRLRGVIRDTFVRGERVWSTGSLAKAASGKLL